jgi:hypothetical protein
MLYYIRHNLPNIPRINKNIFLIVLTHLKEYSAAVHFEEMRMEADTNLSVDEKVFGNKTVAPHFWPVSYFELTKTVVENDSGIRASPK